MCQKILKNNEINIVQLKVFFVMIILYTFYFVINYNLGPTAKYIQEAFSYSSSQFGVLFTCFTIFFAIGQFSAGFLGDRFSAKKMMVIGAFGGIVANILFGLSSNLILFAIIWSFNALFLSLGWSPGCSILFNWIPPKKWGTFMGIFNAFSFLGGVIAYPVVGFSISHFGWRYAFFIPPVLLLLWSFIYIKIVSDHPKEKGYKTEWGDDTQVEKVNGKDYLKILKHPTMNLVNICAICSQFVRWGLVNWIVKILIEPTTVGGFGLTIVIATVIASLMHWGGAIISIVMGWISDTLFKGKRWQVILIGFMLSGISLLMLYLFYDVILASTYNTFILGCILFVSGGCIQGLQAPIFNMPGDILGTRLGGTGVGITNGWSYIGASLSGIFLGIMLDQYGLLSGILLMSLVSFLGCSVVILLRKI